MSIFGFSSEDGNGHIVMGEAGDFYDMRAYLARRLLETEPVNHGKWQTLDVSQSSAHATYELLNSTLWYQMPQHLQGAVLAIKPSWPWAEDHFQERVAGYPINPGVEHENWPFHQGHVELHQHGGKYDHNYMERMWPKLLHYEYGMAKELAFQGYRFNVGDLGDVIDQLKQDRGTRQAYLPIWFPEDTGATSGQRVPCSLGYHFIIREGILHLQYNLRSCEIYRHFTNDIYMAVRLAQHVASSLEDNVTLGQLTTHIVSLHGFIADHDVIEGMQA